jgi:malonate-semialdehyde dehydrogenase (acetylating)/methylmalonate-semialdehyde dehydrogenase
MNVLKNYINGKFVASKSTQFIDIMDPAKDEVIALKPNSTQEEIDKTIAMAQAAFPGWRDTPGIKRIHPLIKLHQLLLENLDKITEAVVVNHGKEWAAARGEVIRGYQMVEAALSVPEVQKGQFMSNIGLGIDEFSVLEPLGVVLIIVPFNFPAMIPFWFLPFAVATGNTVIIKSNSQTPLAMQLMTEYIDQAGFPNGVINYLHCNAAKGDYLIKHPLIKAVSSVGSTPVATHIYKTASDAGKRAQCHGGANNFLMVTEQANLDSIMPNMMNSCYGNTGQRCLSGSVVMVVGSQEYYVHFKKKFLEATNALKIGYGMDKENSMGPIVSKKALATILKQIQDGIDEGAELILDGRDLKIDGYPNGYWLGPCVYEKAKPGMNVYDDEIFGPVVCLDRVDTLTEAIEISNAHPMGNAITIYTENGSEAREFRYNSNAGQIGINIGIVAPIAWFPFAGAKNSFFGSLRAQGPEVIKFYTKEVVVIEKFHGTTEIPWD